MRLRDLKKQLTIEQIKAAEAFVENALKPKAERLTLEALAKEIGISARTLYNWRQDYYFTTYVNHRADNGMEQRVPLVYSQIMRAIEGGRNGEPSIKAIELFLKMTGRLKDTPNLVEKDIDEKLRPTKSLAEISDEIDELHKFMN